MKDKRIRHRQAEITAVTEHRARCFVITRGDLPSLDMAQRIITNKTAIFVAAKPIHLLGTDGPDLPPLSVAAPLIPNDGFNENVPGSAMQNAMPVQILQPGDISDAIAFLVSDQARWITGVSLPVDAGFSER